MMRTTRRLLVVALLLLPSLGLGAQAQDSSGSSPAPTAAASPAQGGNVLWYGKAPPGWGGLVTKIKLLAPGVGWAERGGRFYWTTDNGANWKDITPPSSSGLEEHISDFYFLDSQRGWALFGHFNKDESDEDKYKEPEIDLASTNDAGATWTRMQSTLPSPADYGNPERAPLRGWGGTIAFLDSMHGWMNITLAKQGMNTFFSCFLATSDGGRTWSQVPSAPTLADADMLLVTPSDGWMIGASQLGGKELFVTHDGTKSWHQVLVETPKEVLPAKLATYSWLPIFEDSKHGLLEVSYTGGVGVNPAEVLFSTGDGGRTWNLDRMVKSKYNSQGYGSATVVDSAWVWVRMRDSGPKLTVISKGTLIDISADTVSDVVRHSAVGQLSFATPAQGWAIVGDGELVSTADGGNTWTTLTPGPQPHVTEPHGSFIQRESFERSAAPTPENTLETGGPVGPIYNTSKHLGFDTVATGTTAVMQAWWNYSPYHDVGIYLSGSDNHIPQDDPNLDNDAWVNTVTAMGWGLMPIWVGLQAPAGCNKLHVSRISQNRKLRVEQADTEAVSAESSATTAGIGEGNIIYYDMEGYNDSAGCNSSVVDYLKLWIGRIHNDGFKAGVYVSGSNADILARANPDAVYVAVAGKTSGSARASIWQIYKNLHDSQFPNHQRIHQYNDGDCPPCLGIPNVKWGGQFMVNGSREAPQQIDLDIEDAPVVGGGGTKPIQVYGEYPFSVFADCTALSAVIPGLPCNVVAYGINNPQLNSTPNQIIGDIVGEISEFPGGGIFQPSNDVRGLAGLADESANTYPCTENIDPFTGNPVSFSWGFATSYLQSGPSPPPAFLPDPPAACFAWEGPNLGSTLAASINNLNTIVGQYNQNTSYAGCEMPSGSDSSGCPSANAQYEYAGINDIGWIAAQTVPDANGNTSASLIAGTTTVSPPSGSFAGGINGFGQMVYTDDSGLPWVFDYNGNNSPSSVSMQVNVVGINNNNEAVAVDGNDNIVVIQDADTATGPAGNGEPVGCPQMAAPNGINDWGQIVGLAVVLTNPPFIGNGEVTLGDVCIPFTGN